MPKTETGAEAAPAEGARGAATIAGELGDILGRAARVDTVFGEPVTQGGVTVVTVARARWGFGGGGRRREGEDGHPLAGMGGGGGMRVEPVGMIVVRNDDAEFRPITTPPRWGLIAGLFALGYVIGRL